MESEGASKITNEQGSVQNFSGEEGPPISMNLASLEYFSQVIFTNIQKSYPPKTDIHCSFHKRKHFQSGNRDWVGIFKVGWQTTKEYYTWVSVSRGMENNVLFKAYYLPKDDEYYQFCYVDQNGEVRGVSIPFQFIEDEEEIVLVTTQEEMEKIIEENRRLEEKNHILTEMIKNLEANLQKNYMLEKENKEMQIQVKNFEEEKEIVKAKQLETVQQQNKVQELQTALKEKNIHLEKIETENKQLRSENEAKQQELVNLGGLLDNCKEELIKQKDKLELQTRNLTTERMQKEELQHSLEEEKKKVLDLESNFKKTTALHRLAEDNISKLQQQLTLQQTENEAKDKEIKNMHLDLAHLEVNATKLKDNCKEHLRTIENLEKGNIDLKERLNRQSKNVSDLENKIRKLETDLRCTEENRTSTEQTLAKEQHKSKKNEEIIANLNYAVELREKEMTDLREQYERKQVEVDELTSKLMQAQFATPNFPSFSTTSQAQGMFYGNPYEDIPPRVTAENESLQHFVPRLEQEEIQAPTSLTCPMCNKMFSNVRRQVFEDHVMCHTLDN
ncbi:calcium-binding and coiled-coil domain-containing protein 2 [Pyxicephalus adspersus]|uniref:calcium-binding and coiled-coil domain-containing protein 2 n=1 Tax=Pyxicephalus adspersus TaxID=30357 RepID=UPI003B5BD774